MRGGDPIEIKLARILFENLKGKLKCTVTCEATFNVETYTYTLVLTLTYRDVVNAPADDETAPPAANPTVYYERSEYSVYLKHHATDTRNSSMRAISEKEFLLIRNEVEKGIDCIGDVVSYFGEAKLNDAITENNFKTASGNDATQDIIGNVANINIANVGNIVGKGFVAVAAYLAPLETGPVKGDQVGRGKDSCAFGVPIGESGVNVSVTFKGFNKECGLNAEFAQIVLDAKRSILRAEAS
jgi:hypothetical protein